MIYSINASDRFPIKPFQASERTRDEQGSDRADRT